MQPLSQADVQQVCAVPHCERHCWRGLGTLPLAKK